MKRLSCALFAPILAIFLPLSAQASAGGEQPAWTFGAGFEATSEGYVHYVKHYRYGYYHLREQLRTGDGWAVGVSASRGLGRLIWLRGDVRYLRYDDEYPFASRAPNNGPRAGRRLAEIPSLGLGARFEASPSWGDQGGSLFIEVLPTLYLARWTEEFDYGGGRVDEYHMTKMAGGFALGAGIRLSPSDRYHLEVGPRYLWSGDIGWAIDPNHIGNAQGLSEFLLGVRLVAPLGRRDQSGPGRWARGQYGGRNALTVLR